MPAGRNATQVAALQKHAKENHTHSLESAIELAKSRGKLSPPAA